MQNTDCQLWNSVQPSLGFAATVHQGWADEQFLNPTLNSSEDDDGDDDDDDASDGMMSMNEQYNDPVHVHTIILYRKQNNKRMQNKLYLSISEHRTKIHPVAFRSSNRLNSAFL